MGQPIEFDPVPASHTWTVVDLTAPETTIDFGPSGTTISTSAYIGVSSDDPTATITCTLNGADEELRAGRRGRAHRPAAGLVHVHRAGRRSGRQRRRDAGVELVDDRGRRSAPGNTPVGDNVVVSLPQPGGTGNATVTFFSVDTAGFTSLDAARRRPAAARGLRRRERLDLRHLDDGGVQRAGHRLPHLRPGDLLDHAPSACSTSTARSGSTSRR